MWRLISFCSVMFVCVHAFVHANPNPHQEGGAIVSQAQPNLQTEEEDAQTRFKRLTVNRAVVYPENLLVSSRIPTKQQKDQLRDQHNLYRSMVPAQNMRYMFWSETLARSAQRHANRCDFRHSVDRVGTGENIWAAPYADYTDAARLWYIEVHDPKCHCPHHYKKCCGHYTQMVWAKSYQVGCGAAHCRDIWGVRGRGHRNVLVCHYTPAGNTVMVTPKGQFAVPAFKWTNATHGACSACPRGLNNCHNKKLCW